MNRQKIKDKVKIAVQKFVAKGDGELLNLAGGIHEQAISHRIAVYLEPLFKGYHVDCEYNKHGAKNDKKMAENTKVIRKECGCKSCVGWLKKTHGSIVRIRPDIIVHKERGKKSEGNILVIEIKKKDECLFDMAKLKEMTSNNGDFKYKLGVLIYFPNGEPAYKGFVNGEETTFD